MDRAINKNFEQLENGTPLDKIIVIKSVFKTGKTTVQPVNDGSGWFKGLKRLSEEDKRSLTFWAEPSSKCVIKDGVTFNLNDEQQRVTWEWVKHCPCIAKDEETCQHTPGAEFYIYLENEEATKSVSRRELKYKAVECILKDNSVNYPMRAELLGVNMDYAKPNVIKEFLLDQAESSPDKVLAIYEGADVSVRLLLLKSRKEGHITVDESGFYRYGNVVMGMSEKAAIDWMQDKDHKHLVEMLEKETNPDYFTKSESKSEKTEDKTDSKDDTKVTVARGGAKS